MIQSIGFKNFRRFEKFDDMKLGKINIFVGRNNAGKSTVMKAIELFKGNLKHLSYIKMDRKRSIDMRPAFSFDTEETAEIHIDNFERALYNKAKRKEITLSAGYNDFHVEIVLDGVNMKKEDSFVSVPYSSIHFSNENMNVMYDFSRGILDAYFYRVTEANEEESDMLIAKERHYNRMLLTFSKYLSEIEEQISKIEPADLNKAAERQDLMTKKRNYQQRVRFSQRQLQECQERLSKLQNFERKDIHIYIEDMQIETGRLRANVFQQIFDSMFDYAQLGNRGIVVNPEKENIVEDSEKDEMIDLIYTYRSAIGRCARMVERNLTLFSTEYIPAHAASQKVIFLKDDKNDFLSATLNEFCKLHLRKSDAEWIFIKTWMEEHFEIGSDFVIDPIQGAGYTIKIIDGKTDKKGIDLADKGVGTIQLMTLLLRLAVIMRGSTSGTTILIEEPEQNIHPMLQEKLADLLLDFHNECEKKHKNVQLIVETHSEYLVRRIQGIVSDANYKDEEELKSNPFNIYYFDSGNNDLPWYKMEFETTGGFKPGCEFKPGFYNTAADLDMKIILKEQANQHFDF